MQYIGYIYKITNLINGKEYVGQTGLSIEERFKEHIRASQRGVETPLYKAFRKYGIENFIIEELEQCNFEKLNNQEKFWIQNENSYSNGYNATLGGEGSRLIDYQQVFDYWQQGLSTKEIASKLGKTDTDQIRKILKEVFKISSKEIIERSSQSYSKKIICLNKENECIEQFESIMAAARWIKENNYSSSDLNGIAAHIGQCCNGKRKSAYKFFWKEQ